MSVGGTMRLKHFGQSGHPIPEPVLLTTPPAMMTRNKTIIVNLLAFINLFSPAGYITLSLCQFKIFCNRRIGPRPNLLLLYYFLCSTAPEYGSLLHLLRSRDTYSNS